MNDNSKKSKQLTGITRNGSGENQVIVMQKNGVLRVRPLKKNKQGGRK